VHGYLPRNYCQFESDKSDLLPVVQILHFQVYLDFSPASFQSLSPNSLSIIETTLVCIFLVSIPLEIVADGACGLVEKVSESIVRVGVGYRSRPVGQKTDGAVGIGHLYRPVYPVCRRDVSSLFTAGKSPGRIVAAGYFRQIPEKIVLIGGQSYCFGSGWCSSRAHHR